MAGNFMADQALHRSGLACLIGCGILLAIFAATAWTAWLKKSATCDEPLHFVSAWIQVHDDDFRCNCEDPPLWKYYLALGTDKSTLVIDRKSALWPAMLNMIPAPAYEFSVHSLYRTAAADELLSAGRARMLVLALSVGGMIGWWAWRLRGPTAAIVAVAVFAFDPNFLAHGPLVKNDVAITLVFLLLMMAIWLMGEQASIPRILAVAILIGVALTVKFSGILAIPILAIALLCRVLIDKPWPMIRWTARGRLQRLAAAGAIFAGSIALAYLLIWACYRFRFGSSAADPLAKFTFRETLTKGAGIQATLAHGQPPSRFVDTATLQKWVDQWHPDPTMRLVLFANRHHLLPQSWLIGFLYTYVTSLARPAYLYGQLSPTGFWYYFPAAMAFKTPLATLIALAGALAFWISRWRKRPRVLDPWRLCAVLIAPLLYAGFAIHSHLNIGLRHILPVYPFLFIFVGVIAADAWRYRPKITGVVLAILLLGLCGETYCAYPDYIPFFNVAAGGSRGGLGLLSDSNIDWGQDLPTIAKWQREHPDHQLYLCDFGCVDPKYYGIHYIDMYGSYTPYPDATAPNGYPPIFAISADALQGTYLNPQQNQTIEPFRHERPVDVLGGCIYLFQTPTGIP